MITADVLAVDSTAVIVVVLVVLLAAVLQAVCGFGFAIVAAPALATVLPLAEAISIIAVAGLLTNVTILLRPGAGPPLDRTAVTIAVASVPGLVLGGLVLARAPDVVLQGVLLVAVVAAVVLLRPRTAADPAPVGPGRVGPVPVGPAPVGSDGRDSTVGAVVPRGGGRRSRGRRTAAELATGFTSGLLATTTSVSGPPLVIFVRRFVRAPVASRDLLVRVGVLQSPVAIASLAAAGALHLGWLVVAALPAAVLGRVVGGVLLARMTPAAYWRTASAVLVLAVALALVGLLREAG